MTSEEYKEKYQFEPMSKEVWRFRVDSDFQIGQGKLLVAERGYECPFCGRYAHGKNGFVKSGMANHSYGCELKTLAKFYGEEI